MSPTVNPSSAPYPKAMLGYDGTNYYVLKVDSDGHLQIDALSVALPTGAATAANQATMITALQLIDDLRAALSSVGTDELQVRGEDQLFSISGIYREALSGTVGAGGTVTISGSVVPSGQLWVITNAMLVDWTSSFTSGRISVWDAPSEYTLKGGITKAQYEPIVWTGWVVLQAGEGVNGYVVGGTNGDSCYFQLRGFKMTVES